LVPKPYKGYKRGIIGLLNGRFKGRKEALWPLFAVVDNRKISYYFFDRVNEIDFKIT